ncbi:MAG: DEAD/DEAH box helicase family protein, partial [Acidobacteria bacterium]|nr:DEAD/DEAH box helicase family protein [Acidobacteriota bacterium]
GFVPRLRPGVRVRVTVGRRRLTGVVVDLPASAPEGVRLKELEALVDAEPLLPPDLLELARFASDYYLAPLGEVLRAILPLDLSGWGQRRAQLTDSGALWQGAEGTAAAVVEALRLAGRLTLSELQKRLGGEDLPAVLNELARAGRLHIHDAERPGARYLSAFELTPGELAEHLDACGRSAPGRAVVEYLGALDRPSTAAELTSAVGCTPAVLRRLVERGVLRKFSQVERAVLDRHLMARKERKELVLRPDQTVAVAALVEGLETRHFHPFLLHGMTGAGKTEVYLRAVEATLAQGRTAILLVPEIALVPALARAVRDRFGDRLALLHSNLTPGEGRQEWLRIESGGASVVVGPR